MPRSHDIFRQLLYNFRRGGGRLSRTDEGTEANRRETETESAWLQRYQMESSPRKMGRRLGECLRFVLTTRAFVSDNQGQNAHEECKACRFRNGGEVIHGEVARCIHSIVADVGGSQFELQRGDIGA